MTRGKHAASAAKARAETWQERAERAEAEAQHWKRLALQHKANAARADVLERALKKEREVTGLPVHEHERALDALEAKWQTKWNQAQVHFAEVIDGLVLWVPQKDKIQWLTKGMLDAMAAMPEVRDLLLDRLEARRRQYKAYQPKQLARYRAIESVRYREIQVLRKLLNNPDLETVDDICNAAPLEVERLDWIDLLTEEMESGGRDLSHLRARVAELKQQASSVTE